MIRVPTPVLAATAGALALASAVVGPLATAEEAMPIALVPDNIPLQAFLTGDNVVRAASVAGLDVAATRRGQGYQLVFSNPTDQPITVALDVATLQTSGQSFGRMGPMMVEIDNRTLRVAVAPGEKRTEAVAVPALPAAEAVTETQPDQPLLQLGAFSLTQVQLSEHGRKAPSMVRLAI